jgi:hypothetical protein
MRWTVLLGEQAMERSLRWQAQGPSRLRLIGTGGCGEQTI